MTAQYRINRPQESSQAPKRIDYERMRKEWPKQVRALAAAQRSGDIVKVAEVCRDAVRVWDEIGCWPDDWSRFQRALDDMLHWSESVSLEDLAYHGVTITRAEDAE